MPLHKGFFGFILYNFTKNMVVEIIISFFPILIPSLGFWGWFDFEKIPDLQNAAAGFLSLLWSPNLFYTGW